MKSRSVKRYALITALLALVLTAFLALSFGLVAEGLSDAQNPASKAGASPTASADFKPKMSITLHSNLIVNVYIPAEGTLSFTFDGDLYEDPKNSEDTVTIDGVQYYKVSRELAINEAARDLLLTVSVKFGESVYNGSFTFSIPEYAKTILSSESKNVEKTLIKDTLAYISSAYTYFEADNAEAVCEEISEIIGSYCGKYGVRSSDVSAVPGIKGATFALGAQPSVRFYIDDAKSISDYKFYSGNRSINEITEGEDENGKYLSVSLLAYKMCAPIHYTVDGVSGSYGIQNYYSYISKSAYTDERKTELRELVRKFYNYCASAADYYIDFHSEESRPETLNISDFVIVYPANANESVILAANELSLAIKNVTGVTLSVYSDREVASSAKKIFVGYSTLIEAPTTVRLYQNDSSDAFILDFDEGSVSLLGKTDDSTVMAVKYFKENYIEGSRRGRITLSEGASVIKPYYALENGSEIVVETVSTVFETVSGVYNGGIYPSRLSKSYYPSVIELKHNGKNNGKLIAILAVNDTPTSGYTDLDTNSCVMESSDGGKTWKMIARPQETINPTFTAEDGTEYKIQGISMAHIYELPSAVGDMPEGTLLYSGTSVNYDCYSQVAIWRSFDCGYTWEEYTVVDTGGGLREGVWEPFTWYEESDGYLYCFYSDDSDPAHDQRIVYKRSRNGVNWSEEVEVCAFARVKDRPGMVIMTEIGSGKYFMVYEYYGTYGGKVLYKITDDISSWNPTDAGKVLDCDGYTVGGGPACVWTPYGGDNGILFASGKTDTDGGEQHKLFVSFDCGETWDTIENPLDYDITLDIKETNRIGHSPVFIVGSDTSVVYYLNTTVNPATGLQRVEFAKLRIYS